MPKLEVEALRVTLGHTQILKGVSTSFEEGEIVVLLGPSGCGKTTLLRSIAGLEHPTSGRIAIDGLTVYDSEKGIDLPSEKRNLGLVFQSYALWPHKTVYENVAYALRLRKQAEEQIRATVEKVLAGIGLEGMHGRYPHQLSGGQQQRVALARSMAYSPPVLLLDEPLSNLDAKLREDARIWIRSLIKSLGLSAIFVTHDQVEAMAIADRIVLMDAGRIAQSGTPEALYGSPASLFAAEFMGANNQLRAAVTASTPGSAVLDLGGQPLRGKDQGGASRVGTTGVAVIRVESVGSAATQAGDNALHAELETAVYLGGKWEAVYRLSEHRIRAFHARRPADGPHTLNIPQDAVWFFADPPSH
ncbi:ABC transporter ATP-binding protein [Ramlibacter sp. G-1-2-2]|uniref:ABC transporter ATP-binding protein n=1 Tax=Ramlibacter agri TaxID=2728837 RepID=A0A848H393_9BURK|nr:ABC transporter ATP-binding protein [Ramlibacter agri]NML42258.1 ABC transporter ATP-binding protein [Ramlibacter agri]